MSKVKHEHILQMIDPQEADFPAVVSRAIGDVVSIARDLGTTVDWTTLTIEPGEQFETVSASGVRQRYTLGLMLHVDSVVIE